ncbi:hypothetical protein Gmet_3602 [Geobacter metallireducens GS-15]|uniref:Uncharacterized protein n=1 Tax=Geobacter metallireducens (strain ATCC 53774 / DSM 7210 / GS-15) TaxID=269799 RepID=J7LWA8_GEOMG|nr:hypothetical protein Gmet_3602 [Geobacter metallireducens GS-15]
MTAIIASRVVLGPFVVGCVVEMLAVEKINNGASGQKRDSSRNREHQNNFSHINLLCFRAWCIGAEPLCKIISLPDGCIKNGALRRRSQRVRPI